MMQYSSTQASKKGGQMLEHWGHLCETYEGAGAANLYFDRKSWMEHFNSHPEIYCTQLFYVKVRKYQKHDWCAVDSPKKHKRENLFCLL